MFRSVQYITEPSYWRGVRLRQAKLIEAMIQAAINLTSQGRYGTEFKYAGVTVRVMHDSNIALIERDFERGVQGYLGTNPVVGPYPSAELSSADKANDQRIETAKQDKIWIEQTLGRPQRRD